MRAYNNNTVMPTTWTYGIIWATIMSIAAVALRVLLWYILVWMGDPYIFSDTFCGTSVAMLCVGFPIAVIMYLVAYSGYKKLAAVNIMDLHGVCHDVYGKPWVLPLILDIVLGLVWMLISAVILAVSVPLNIFVNGDDMTVMLTYLAISLICQIVEGSLFGLGVAFFKPKEVMQKK